MELANLDLLTIVEGVLYSIGFHKHHRGEWRMHRSVYNELRKRIDEPKEQVAALPSPLINYQAPYNDTEAVELFKKARDGNEKAKNEVRKLIVARGWISWIGNISQAATNNLIHYAASFDSVWKAGIHEQVEVLLKGVARGETVDLGTAVSSACG